MKYVGEASDGRKVQIEEVGGTKWRVQITKPSGATTTYTSNRFPRVLRYVARQTSSLPFIPKYTTQMSNKQTLIETYSNVLLLEEQH